MKYIIISLKHGTYDKVVFWRANDAGYTDYPFEAGIYTEEQIKSKPGYYNDGFSTVAVPLNDVALTRIGFKVVVDEEALTDLLKANKSLFNQNAANN